MASRSLSIVTLFVSHPRSRRLLAAFEITLNYVPSFRWNAKLPDVPMGYILTENEIEIEIKKSVQTPPRNLHGYISGAHRSQERGMVYLRSRIHSI